MSRPGEILFACAFSAAVLFAAPGCVSRSAADARVKAAFLAGQQQGLQMARQQQIEGPSVTFVGSVRHTMVPWNPNLTLAQAIVAADYYGPDPTSIMIVREGKGTLVDARKLMEGEDVPLFPRDLIEIKHEPAP